MSYIRKLFSNLGQQGVIHLIPLLLILAGIIGGVYLVQKEGFQLFQPKAYGENVVVQDGACVGVKEGKKVLTCGVFKLFIRSPLETDQTTDIGPNMSFVKTAYAHDGGLNENEARTCQSALGVPYVSRKIGQAREGLIDTCWFSECREYQFEDGHKWAGCFPKMTTFSYCANNKVVQQQAGGARSERVLDDCSKKTPKSTCQNKVDNDKNRKYAECEADQALEG